MHCLLALIVQGRTVSWLKYTPSVLAELAIDTAEMASRVINQLIIKLKDLEALKTSDEMKSSYYSIRQGSHTFTDGTLQRERIRQ